MPVLVESEEEEDGDADCKDPLPEKLQSSMVRTLSVFFRQLEAFKF